MSKNKPKTKKEKIRYIDDGSTVADMSGVSGRGLKSSSQGRKSGTRKPRASIKEQGQTYLNACKQMLIPMLVTIGIICVAFGILWLILTFA